MKRLVAVCLCWIFCCLLATEGLCASSRGAFPFRAAFSHYADNENICTVLSAFARAEGYGSVCSPALKGQMSGRFEQVDPRTFLNGMRSAFGVRWYTQGRTVTFWNDSEQTEAFLAPSTVSAAALRDMLRSAGMISPQLPVKLLHAQNLLSVSGPPIYLDQLRGAMKAFEDAQGSRSVMRVFPLKYAWAEDMKVNSMDSTVTIPGVASILQAMANGTPLTGSQVTVQPSAQGGLRGKGLIAMNASTDTSQASPAVPQNGKDQSGTTAGPSIIADPRVNAVVVTDAEYRMSYYAKVIADLDKPVELVEIHAAIVDIDSDFSRDFGVNWSGTGAYGKHWTGGGSAGGTSTSGIFPSAGASSAGGLSYSTLYSYGSDYFLARVTALEEDGQARVLGKPSVLTMDNVQASLENTSSYYVPVSGNESSDLFKIDSGTVLKVTPHIIPGLPGQADSIKLMVSVQDDRDDGSSLFSVDPNNLSPIKQTKINTQAIVGEGQSLLIGGHYYEIQSDAETGIPGLKNIPILGGLFGSTGKKHQRMERLILITPRIVRMDTASNVPSRVDDPRFSRTPTQADYEERRPKEMPVGGCARRRELAPDVQPAPPVTVTPQPAPVPATNKSIQNSTMPQPILTPVSTGAQPVPAPVGSTSVSAGGRQ